MMNLHNSVQEVGFFLEGPQIRPPKLRKNRLVLLSIVVDTNKMKANCPQFSTVCLVSGSEDWLSL